MTVELSPASSETKPAAASEAKSNKAGTAGAAKSGAGGPGGFLAVLAAVDSDPTGSSVDSDQGLQSSLSGSLTTALTDSSDLTDANAKVDPPMDAAALLAQSLQWAPAQPAGGDGPGTARQALASQTMGRQLGGEAQDVAFGAVTARKPGKGVPDLTVNQPSSEARLTNPSGASGQSPSDGKALQFAQKMESIQAQFSAVATAVASASSSVGSEERARDHSIFKPAAAEVASAPQPGLTSAPSVMASSESGVVAPPEVYVAEQIKYWISNDVQSAEMKLDGIGDNPVEVSITMQGNEAHVSFRTDELQAREVLESAGPHLKELLQREGLVLSGVSVGTAGAGAGDSGAQERKSRQGAKSVVVVAAQPIRADIASAAGRISGRAVDLFV